VGAVIALGTLFAGPVSGASMNPARSPAPALVSGPLQSLRVYLTAPVLGGGVAVLVCCCVPEAPCCRAVPEESSP
jgi:glycerol uptake facilitator-like aquaporin